jgi:hypothetical protein
MATTKASDLTLGNFLKIVSKGGVYNNLSEDSPIWELIKKKKKGPDEGRELRFLLRSAYGSAAAGFVSVDGGAYPTAQQATVSEGTAQYKDFALTVEVERTLIAKAMSDFSRYGEPLAEELRSKTIALSRQLSRAAYADGTGVLAQISGTPTVLTVTGGADQIRIPLSSATGARGFVGWLEVGDKVAVYNTAGTIQGITAGAWDETNGSDYCVVKNVDRQNNRVDLACYDASAGAEVAVTAVDAAGDGDFIYRFLQGTREDLSGSITSDYQTHSEDFVGLGSLSENDSRVVNGITLDSTLGGTRRDASGNPIDSQDFQQLMSQVMVAVGQGRYKYSKSMMAWETLDALIESREVDRRFQSVQDNKRGTSSLGYIHGRNTLMFEADEFCRKDRIYCLPDADVLQFHGSDFEFVKPEGGQKFFLTPNSSADGHKRSIRAYMEGSGVLVSTHGAALGVIENFTT